MNLWAGVKQIFHGDIHSCVVIINGNIKCWGNNLGEQLGDESIISSAVPKTISVGKDMAVTQVALVGYHTCAVLKSNELKCWGLYDY